MTTWDDFLAVTHPGTELEVGAERWLLMRRSCAPGPPDLDAGDNHMIIAVEFVRAGSPADPRTPPTPNREDPRP